MNNTPSGERIHIGFFGMRNAGKSSLVNQVTGQDMSVVSDVKGTTTDPVSKSMELLPLGPVVIIDTPGFDDLGELGAKRVQKTTEILRTCDIAVLVVDASAGMTEGDNTLLELIRKRGIPYQIVWNKADAEEALPAPDGALAVSSLTGDNIHRFKEQLSRLIPDRKEVPLIPDIVHPGDLCVLVCPIDESAPKGRLILPQQQTIRELLDMGAIPVVSRETELEQTLSSLGKRPALVITDSQAFAVVNRIVPEDIPLTSFSILMARHKGFLDSAVRGISAVKKLNDEDTVLMAEGCTHHRQCNDIGTVKIPNWLRSFTKKDIKIETCSGKGFPEDLSGYSVIIHCGGCMLTEAAIASRRDRADEAGIPFTNYGIVIANITGALERSLRIFPELHDMLEIS